jgi:glycosyltransferase involved in cell wall biosynthesis
MRILFDARRSVARSTGIGRLIDGLLRALARRGGADEYLVLAGEHDPLGGIRASNIEVRRIGLRLNSPFINTTLPALARGWKADVAYFPFWYAPVAMPCPFVVAIHDLIQIAHPEGFSLAHRAAFHLYARLAARRASRVHVLASHGRRELARAFDLAPERLDVVPPAVSGCAGTPVNREPVALYVGNHKPHKNLARLLRAFARVAGRIESNLVVAGASSSQSDPQSLPHLQLIRELSLESRVRFVGQVDETALAKLYRSSRFFVFPSLYEGFGIPPLEAMACGTPVTCSNTTSLPEVVGDAALTFDPLDEESIGAALVRIDQSCDLRAALSQKGLERARAFSWSNSAEAWSASMRLAAAR